MSHWQEIGKSDEWYTPAYIFEALSCTFDLDVASPPRQTHVPCRARLTSGALEADWSGFVWMNPPFGGRNQIRAWLEKFVQHGNGIALTPDRTSAPWFQWFAPRVHRMLFLSPKVKFERPDGSAGLSPSGGTVLHAIGWQGEEALARAAHLGFIAKVAA